MNCIKFEKPKNKLYLTLSVILKNNNKGTELNKIQQYQEEISKFIEKEKLNLKIFKSRNILKKELGKRSSFFIYQYQKDRIHFSLVNFLTYDINKNFENERKIIEKKREFQETKEKIEEIIKSQNILNTPLRTEIKKIYIPEPTMIENSLALNIYPPKGFFKKLKQLKIKVQDGIKENNPLNIDSEIKAYPKEDYHCFSINIFRFITFKENFGICCDLWEKIAEINQKLKKKPLTFNIKTASLLISDPYLANNGIDS